MTAPAYRAKWRKSTRSASNGDCVEVADLPGTTAVRDSKNPDGGNLVFARGAFARMLTEVKRGQYDL